MPPEPVPTSQTRRSSESTLAKKVQGLENPSFSAKLAQENQYVHDFPTSVNLPLPNTSPPAYTPTARPDGKHESIRNYEEINDLESNGYAEIGGPI